MKRFNLNFEMRKKLSTQIEKRERERERFGNERRRKSVIKRKMIFLTIHCSEVQYIYVHKEQPWPYQRSLNLRD